MYPLDLAELMVLDRVYWLYPSTSTQLPSHVDTQLLLLSTEENVYAILPLTTQAAMGTVRCESHDVVARFEVDSLDADETDIWTALIALDKNIRGAVKSAIDGARQLRSEAKFVKSEKREFFEGLT
jgi:hypothetical protein